MIKSSRISCKYFSLKQDICFTAHKLIYFRMCAKCLSIRPSQMTVCANYAFSFRCFATERITREENKLLKKNEENRQDLITRPNRTAKRLKIGGDNFSEFQKENIWTIPNFLCVSRILTSPFLGFLIVQSNFQGALYLMMAAGITDLMDGYIARNFKNQSSKLGSFLDPMADKILMATMFLSLTYVNLMPVPLTVIIVVRDVSLAAAGFYIRYMSLPPPRTLSGYFDASRATAQLSPTLISKVNTLIQLIAAGATLASPIFQFHDHVYLSYLWWLTGASTILSGLSYLFTKNTYQFLRKDSYKIRAKRK